MEFLDLDDGIDYDADIEEEEDAIDDNDPDGKEQAMAHAVDDGVVDDPDDTQEEKEDDDSYRDVFSKAGNKMADVAMALLASRNPGPNPILAMRMRSHLRHNYMSMGRILDDAVASGKVRAATLSIVSMFHLSPRDDDDHDQRSTQQRTQLVGYGRRFKTLLDACPTAFGALTQLSLENVRYGGGPDDFGDSILTTCTRLESLSLFYCGFKHERGCGVCGTRGLKASGSPCATLGASSSDGFLDWSASL